MRNAWGSYYYAAVYVLSVLVFGLAADPTLLEDYGRIGGLAWALVVVVWVIETAVVYRSRFYLLPEDRRQRMLYPRRVCGMGIAFTLALASIVKDVIELFHRPLVWHGLPLLLLTLSAASYWLWPLRKHEYKMRHREGAVSRG